MLADIHSHILPEVDDGAENMAMTENILKMYVSEGITDIIATPHYSPKNFSFSLDKINYTYFKVVELVKKLNLPLNIYLGNEIYYSEDILDKLDKKMVLSLNETQYVLVEFFPFVPFNYMYQALKKLLICGYIPIVAHAERYEVLQNIKKIENIIQAGVCIQINSEVINKRDIFVRRYIFRLFKEKFVHFLGTDTHNVKSRKPNMVKPLKKIKKHVDEDYYYNLTEGNFLKLIKGEYIV